jgi:hypothetical protein
MSARDPLTDQGAGVLGPVGGVPMDRTGAPHGCLMEPLLLLFLAFVRGPETLKPILGDLLEELRNAFLLGTGRLLELVLEVRGEAPTVDLCLHEPHCSAGPGVFPPRRPGPSPPLRVLPLEPVFLKLES